LAEITRDISLDPPQEVFFVEVNSANKTNITQVIPPTVRGNINLYKLIIYGNRERKQLLLEGNLRVTNLELFYICTMKKKKNSKF